MDDNDKVIRLSEMLRMKAFGGDPFVVVFIESDADNDLAPGDTERLLDQAITANNLEILLKGTESVRIGPRTPSVSFRHSGMNDGLD